MDLNYNGCHDDNGKSDMFERFVRFLTHRYWIPDWYEEHVHKSYDLDLPARDAETADLKNNYLMEETSTVNMNAMKDSSQLNQSPNFLHSLPHSTIASIRNYYMQLYADEKRHSKITQDNNSPYESVEIQHIVIPPSSFLWHHEHFIAGALAGLAATISVSIINPTALLTSTAASTSHSRIMISYITMMESFKSTVPAVALYFTTLEHVKTVLGISRNVDNRNGYLRTSAYYAIAATAGGLAFSFWTYLTFGGSIRRCVVTPIRFGVQFSIFECLKLYWAQSKLKDLKATSSQQRCVRLNLLEVGTCAACGALIAGTSTFPLHKWSAANEICITSTQENVSTTNAITARDHVEAISKPSMGMGFTSAVKSGLLQTLMRFMPSAVITAVVYEYGCRKLHNHCDACDN